MNDPELLEEFLAEARDTLDATDQKLVELEKKPADNELLNAVFRGYHTIKGGAGFLDLHGLIELCHALEAVFDALRNKSIPPLGAGLMNLALEASNEIRAALRAYASNADAAYAPPPGLIQKLAAAGLPGADAPKDAAGASPASQPLALEEYWKALAPACPTTQPESPPMTPSSPSAAQSAYQSQPSEKETHIKVETDRLDAVLTLASEVGLAKNRMGAAKTRILAKDFQEESLAELARAYNDLERVTSMLQNAVMMMRMQPIGRLFSKYPRLARDLGRTLGKNVELTLTGHETEIDKGMIEDLADPLIHLLRNAVDHGIEPEAERLALGKPAAGNVTLSARQEGDRIVIAIQDDGKGINVAALKQKALSKRLLPAQAIESMTDAQAMELIFLPGLSTAEKVNDVSGRGVGMDVVKTNIAKLGGEIALQSQQGQGSSIEIRIPLTLAVLPALLLKAGGQPLAVPLASVQEIISLGEHEAQNVGGKPVINLRGEILSALDLSELLGWGKSPSCPVAAVVDVGNKKAALLAQGFIGRDEVMVKALDGAKPKGVSGVVVDAKGEIVLILDLKELLGDHAKT